jgi:TfoX/Sxy family transcriptional regulator of competence genes
MPYDTKLETRIRSALSDAPGFSARRMFGGVCFLLHGNMVAGVWKEFLILRLGEDAAAFALELPHVRPFDITGRAMKGWVMIEPAGCRSAARLAKWLGQARSFVDRLPPKDL